MHVFEIVIVAVLALSIALFCAILISYKCEKYTKDDCQRVEKSRTLQKKPLYNFVKRTIDIILSSLILIITSPIFLLCFALIKLEDEGPALYRRWCIGYKGKLVYYRAFRTLRLNFDGHSALLSTLSDPRITHIGTFLRITALDYLPIFVDVFMGRLSIVGLSRMRPEMISEEHRKLYDYAKPGLLGLGMTNAKVMDVQERELMDLEYVQSLSLLNDIKILLYAMRDTFVGTTRYIEPPKNDNLF